MALPIKRTVDLQVAEEISRLHAEIVHALRRTVENAIRIGELLTKQKDELKHGEWMEWGESLPFHHRTATNYMRLFRERDKLRTEQVSNLGAAYALLKSTTHE